ncbi:MAG: ABC transporter ATP-binding protein [Oscillospiraceae bacterium]|jgi:ABC-type dipeptide/oligopeptide/nickel transport system ATPase component|nr:ABC transporter ATP-binding protein [Oscillospiraceae bacterium]
MDYTASYQTKKQSFAAVRGVGLHIAHNEAYALVGESGSGKTTLALSPFGLIQGVHAEGRALFEGRDLLAPGVARALWGREVGVAYQNAYAVFDPVYTIGQQIGEALKAMNPSAGRGDIAALLDAVGLAASTAKLYPHELSGGMLQRAQLAVALCGEPKLLIADEPTSALDVTVQRQIIDLLNGLRRQRALSLLIITHDLGVVAAVAQRVGVMHEGQIVETGAVGDLMRHPQHAYTKMLLSSARRLRGYDELATGRQPDRGLQPGA